MTPSVAMDARAPDLRYHRLIDAHFDGRSSPSGERLLRGHLVGCADCRAYYERHLRLAAVDPQAALPARARLGRGLGLSRGGARETPRRAWMAASAIVCAGVLLAVGFGRARLDLQPRGGAAPGSQLLVYELPAGAPPRPAMSEVRADSGLAFAYANIGHKRRLMVFAVDENRRVYWYHPEWRSPDDNPTALDVERDDAIHELPAAITHRFTGQRLQLFGVFLDRALSARDVEALVARAPLDDRRRLQLAVPGADVTRLDLRLVSGR